MVGQYSQFRSQTRNQETNQRFDGNESFTNIFTQGRNKMSQVRKQHDVSDEEGLGS